MGLALDPVDPIPIIVISSFNGGRSQSVSFPPCRQIGRTKFPLNFFLNSFSIVIIAMSKLKKRCLFSQSDIEIMICDQVFTIFAKGI